MTRRPQRTYNSTRRQQQAGETRQRILNAARKRIIASGFAEATIDAIAGEAEVSAQTVYAIFGSKRGIIEGLLECAAFGPEYKELVQKALASDDPGERLRLAARIAAQIYAGTRQEQQLLHGANAITPDIIREREGVRLERQKPTVDLIAKKNMLREGITAAQARDILWTMTGREPYRMLVVERGWSAERYVEWLGNTLVEMLLRSKK